MPSFKRKLLTGVAFMMIAKYSSFFINLIVISIIARLLPPKDFGIVSIATIIIGFFSIMSDFGIASAIIQNKQLDDKDNANIFSGTIYIAFVIVLLYLICLYGLNLIYNSIELIKIGLLLTFQVFFVTINIVPNALLLKKQQFKYISKRTFIVQLLVGLVAVASAISGLGIYSLVIAPIISSILIFIANYYYNRIPFVIRPSINSFKKIFSYSIFNFLYNIMNYFSRNMDKFVIGKVFSMQSLGYYEKSYSLILMPVQNVITVLNPVMHPMLSNYQKDTETLFHYFLKFVKILSFMGFPLSVLLYFSSADIVHIVFGNNWNPSIKIIQVFSISIGFQIIYTLQGPFFLSINQIKKMFYCGLLTSIIILTAIVIGAICGSINLLALLISLSYIITTIYTFYIIVHNCFHKSIMTLLIAIYKPAIISSILIIIYYFLCTIVPNYGAFFNMMWKLSIFVLLLCTSAIVFKEDDVISIIANLLKRSKK